MCGLAGILAHPDRPLVEAALRAMTRAVAHRGPDGEGLWISPDGTVGLGHRRLAIVDLDAAAAQPMANEDGAVRIVFNGEIYNHAALRRELLAAGHHFSTASSDTEVLLHGYEQWGIDGLCKRLEGIYAFALHDGRSGRTLLVRDPVGIKPLYVAWLGGDLLFGSEIRAILAHPGFVGRPALAHLPDYLTFMAVPAPNTLVEGIFKIPAGHRLEVGADRRGDLVRYWRPTARLPQVPSERPALVKALRTELERVVTDQMIADVPVGVMLSGGIDSSTILALATRARGAGINAYSVGFTDDADLDETAEAAMVAAMFGARHHVLRLTPETAIGAIDAMVDALDEPLADWVCLPLHALAAAVQADGTKVVLVGEGADELFAGYEYWLTYLGPVARRFRLAQALAPLARGLAAVLLGDDLRLATRADFLRRAGTGGEAFWGGAILCWPAVRERLLADRSDAAPLPRWRTGGHTAPEAGPPLLPDALVAGWYAGIDADLGPSHPLARMAALEFRHRLPELLLMRVDKMTMAHGVEARVPFLDTGLIEFAMAVPPEQKLAGARTKGLMREAVAGLIPEAIRLAPKKGFGAPVDSWLRGPLADRVRERIAHGPLAALLDMALVERLFAEHRSRRINHAGVIWALYVASRWLERTFTRDGATFGRMQERQAADTGDFAPVPPGSPLRSKAAARHPGTAT
ncbi:MAG: asparagine synthase (glutamine-hydrolyzing) [Proteobacteria bacterium]|nr:asparagine synthase (glutamine-hydrolyzing) [Pseudomonadota bacterium]